MFYLIALLIRIINVIMFPITCEVIIILEFALSSFVRRWICICILMLKSCKIVQIDWMLLREIFRIAMGNSHFTLNIFIATLFVLPNAITRTNTKLFNISAGVVVVIFDQIPPCILLRLLSSIFQLSSPVCKPITDLHQINQLILYALHAMVNCVTWM